ncbi:MAG: hypothetical protein B7Z53_00930 [Rhodospirillales bacterium 12-71-4]|nr:MAG: hypothetical protein B7Z53_00930 [Rhodospirillales bacterium 12-71-4]
MPAEAPSHDELVARHERATDDILHLHLRNPANSDGRLIVTFATHNNGARYASLEAIHRRLPMDILAFRDPSNGYYLYQDGGARFGALLRALVQGYDPAKILLFGSSMGGYAALRWAIELGASCVVSNPQVNLDSAAAHAWADLRANILRIPHRVNLDELPPGPRQAVLTVLHSRHAMDLDAMRRLFGFWLTAPGMALNLEQAAEEAHAYLIRDFPHFRQLVETTLAQRKALAQVPRRPAAVVAA